MLIATLPAVHQADLMEKMVAHPGVGGVRYNVGIRSPYSPRETLERVYSLTSRHGKRLWLDIKGRQLRIVQWAAPQYGRIVLNHELEVDCPAKVYFRGDDVSEIKVVRGNTIYVDPAPRYAVGAGQSINVQGDSLRIEGFLTEEDRLYLEAAKALGVVDIMASFVEEMSDIEAIRAIHPEAQVVAKIESKRGVAFVGAHGYAPLQHPQEGGVDRLMAARDDLFINVGSEGIFSALEKIIQADPEAICASRLFLSLDRAHGHAPLRADLSDLSDVRLMQQMGYRYFLLSDGVSHRCFEAAMRVWDTINLL